MKTVKAYGIILSLLSFETFACSCLKLPLEEQFNSTKNVYFGQLISAQYVKTDTKWPYIDGTIQVHDVLKGKQVKQVQIKTGLGGGDCGIPFVVGKHYSVFVNKDGEYVGSCDATQQVNIYDMEDYINKINSFKNK